MLYTGIKDYYSNALSLFIWSSCFSHIGEAEKDDGKMTFYCPLSVWVAAHTAKKQNEHQGLWVLFICVLAWLIQSEDFFLVRREGEVSLWSNVIKAEDVPVKHKLLCILLPLAERRKRAFSYQNVPKCQRSDSVSADVQKHHTAGHRYFINTWKRLLGSWFQVQFLKCYLITKGRDGEGTV